jgi:hypothetical protein
MTPHEQEDGFFRRHPFLTWAAVTILSMVSIVVLMWGGLHLFFEVLISDGSDTRPDYLNERLDVSSDIELGESGIIFGEIEPTVVPAQSRELTVVAMKTESIDPESMLRLAADMVSINPVAVESALEPVRYKVTVTVTAQE